MKWIDDNVVCWKITEQEVEFQFAEENKIEPDQEMESNASSPESAVTEGFIWVRLLVEIEVKVIRKKSSCHQSVSLPCQQEVLLLVDRV